MRYPETVKLSPNRGGKIKPKFIILHHTMASASSALSWIGQSRSRVSYHYLIDLDGSRTQLVWDSREAWHAGKSSWNGLTSLNRYSVGLAVTGDTNKRELNEHEIESLADKCEYLMRKFNIGIDCILTHQMIASDRKTDVSMLAYHRVIGRLYARRKSQS